MGRAGITQIDVYNAAQAIAEAGDFPTIQSVHAKLGTGSLGTIHKHLLAWKQERLLAPALKFESGKDAIKVKSLVNEKLDLEKTVQLQIEQNVAMSARLISLEQENLELKDNLNTVSKEKRVLSAVTADLTSKISTHDAVFSELKTAHMDMLNVVLTDKNAEIDNLKAELKAVHLASIEMVRKTSFEGQDLLMTERVKTINLTEQIKILNNKVSQLEQKLGSSGKVIRDETIPPKNNKALKSYTLDEIYAQKLRVEDELDEDIA